ncbi:heme-binding domain-containing protein [Mucilaginibacter myungsuensis]|uniref:Heme-binding domain-containing protein n=1 Tax=Mucilaginibacter myungsuensis TaxID=649104 RepID=A0A929KYP5_9SPHI|nr:heme-binding domain-containing protein [Mucilaginibacter myungsuensis]MBE9662980.1 heme-binding domain-containing protein [Mucilaginibacter myungsuensis]MDN3598609.1 heme-binding domain-containing protein [Mucilaginibacter myungsuensis]
MRPIKLGLLLGFIVVVGIQFLPQQRNENNESAGHDLYRTLPVPERIGIILKRSCYDCHSNSTRYPWYAKVQPIRWWLDGHIRDGKKELNFDEFGNYSRRRRQSKLGAVANSVEDGTMPLSTYTLIHQSAKLSDTEKQLIISWMRNNKDSLSRIK